MNPTLEIFSQGDEVVTGQTVDTNAAWLAQVCVQMGFSVTRHSAVGDRLDDLIALLREISARADCCICTGGLGPTIDDLTAEAVAQAFSMPLRFDPIAYHNIERFFRHRKRPMPPTNRKQAMIPEGAERIDNDWGTAPGFALQYRRCRFVFLPGVPSEMRHLFDEKVSGWLMERFVFQPKRLVTIKTVGIGESDLQTLIDPLVLPEAVQLGFRAGIEHVETKLLFPGDFPERPMTDLAEQVAQRIGPFVFGVDGLGEPVGSLIDVVDRLMEEKTVCLVETVSQGLMAAKCLGRNWLKSSVYEASPETLAQRLGVTFDRGNLPQTGNSLAHAVWAHGTVDIVLLQLYGGSPDAVDDKDQTIDIHTTLVHNRAFEQTSMTQEHRVLSGTPERKQNQAALLGLDLLRRYLQTENNRHATH